MENKNKQSRVIPPFHDIVAGIIETIIENNNENNQSPKQIV